jgi:sugar lactone lactonase YvrE
VAAEGALLQGPNGLVWDEPNQRLLIVALLGKSIFEWRVRERRVRTLATGAGGFDGIVITPTGRIFISSQDARAVQELSNGTLRDVLTDLPDPGDIGYDAKRRRILVPLLSENRIEVWRHR